MEANFEFGKSFGDVAGCGVCVGMVARVWRERERERERDVCEKDVGKERMLAGKWKMVFRV